VLSVKKRYFFFLPPFFFAPPFFLAAIVLFSLSIFHGYAVYKIKTAIDDCIELLKIEVKKKIDDIFDCSSSSGSLLRACQPKDVL